MPEQQFGVFLVARIIAVLPECLSGISRAISSTFLLANPWFSALLVSRVQSHRTLIRGLIEHSWTRVPLLSPIQSTCHHTFFLLVLVDLLEASEDQLVLVPDPGIHFESNAHHSDTKIAQSGHF